jgi:hypothetical protein
MALKTLTTSGKWSTTGNWTPSGKPGATDEVLIPAGKEVKIEAAAECLALIAEGAVAGNNVVVVGGSTAPVETAFKEVLVKITGTVSGTWQMELEATSAAGVLIVAIVPELLTQIMFLSSGKYKLTEALKGPATKQINVQGTCELNTNGQEVVCGRLEAPAGKSTLVLGKSLIKLNSAAAVSVWATGEAAFSGAEATLEVVDTGANLKTFVGRGQSYGTLNVPGNNVLVTMADTFGTLGVLNKRKPLACKATWTTLTNHLAVTEGGANLAAGVEVAHAGIPLGTTIVKEVSSGIWEMSATPTEEAAVAVEVTIYPRGLVLEEGIKQTVTTLTCNGTSGEPSRLVSSVAGKQATIKLPAGNHELTGVVRVKDLAVETGVLYLPNGVNLGGNNANVIFETQPAEGIKGKATGTILLTGTAKGILQAIVQGKATGTLLLTGTATGTARAVVAAKATGSLLLTGTSTSTVRSVATGKATGALLLTGRATAAAGSVIMAKGTGALLLTGASKATIASNIVGQATGTLLLTGSGRPFKPSTTTRRSLILIFDE